MEIFLAKNPLKKTRGNLSVIYERLETDSERLHELNRSAFGYKYPLEKTTQRLLQIFRRFTDRLSVV